MAKTKPYSFRLSEERRERIKATAKKVNLDFSESVRLAIDFGLPILEKRLCKKTVLPL